MIVSQRFRKRSIRQTDKMVGIVVASLPFIGKAIVRTYIPEKTFMIIPPLIINSMAKIAGRSGFCL